MTQVLTRDAATQHLQQDIDACTALLGLLNAERDAYQARDMTALETIIQSKTAHLQHLEHSARQRSAWAPAAKLTAGKDVAQQQESAWLTQLQSLDASRLPQQWQTLRGLLQSCQEQNLINGKLLARNQQVFSRLLSIVRGQSSIEATYSAKGSRSQDNGHTKLGEA